MPSLLVLSSVRLGVDLIGALVFFIIAWIFFDAYLLKRDVWSFLRSLGFLLFSFSQIIVGISDSQNLLYASTVLAALISLFISYAFEKLPPKPREVALAATPLTGTFLNNSSLIDVILLVALVLLLTKRYRKDIDKPLKWLIVSFVFVLAAVVAGWQSNLSFDAWWLTAYAAKFLGFVAAGLWVWQWLSLRLREDLLIVFVGVSLFIGLLVTSVFSYVLTQKSIGEAETNLSANAHVLDFYISSLKNKSLASAQIIARDEDLATAVKLKDAADLARIGGELVQRTGMDFLTVAAVNGDAFFKLNFPMVAKENILSEWIGSEALQGRPAVTVEGASAEGFSIRAAAPVFSKGGIAGVIITGRLLDGSFAQGFKKISSFDTTVVGGKIVAASTVPGWPGRPAAGFPQKTVTGPEFVGEENILGGEAIGAFLPVLDAQNERVGTLAITATPAEILASSGRIERLTLLVVMAIVLGLAIPLYRLTVFLATEPL